MGNAARQVEEVGEAGTWHVWDSWVVNSGARAGRPGVAADGREGRDFSAGVDGCYSPETEVQVCGEADIIIGDVHSICQQDRHAKEEKVLHGIVVRDNRSRHPRRQGRGKRRIGALEVHSMEEVIPIVCHHRKKIRHPPAEAAAMDPCQRLLLEVGHMALHDAEMSRMATLVV